MEEEKTQKDVFTPFSRKSHLDRHRKVEEGNREMAIWATRGGEEAPKFGSSTHHGFPNQREEKEAVYRFFCSFSSRAGKKIIGCAFYSFFLNFACLGSFSTTKKKALRFPARDNFPLFSFSVFFRPIIFFLFTCMRERTACDVSLYIVLQYYTQKLGHHGMEGKGKRPR